MKTPEILSQSTKIFGHKWSITLRIIPILLVVTLLKFLAHWYNWEVMELNALFTSLVAGTIFLIGFLITGVLSDYKESEKIPSELAASIKIEPFYASLFFTLLVTFLVVYMLLLIKDIDDPFDYAGNCEGGTEISLKPLNDLCRSVKEE